MDAVIKVGGSLTENPNELRILCNKLSEYSWKYDFVIVPGGGRFADVVREYDQAFLLSQATSHRMAILSMDQYSLLLADIMPRSRLIKTLQDLRPGCEGGWSRIFLPSTLMFEEDPLENSWNVTSDSIAAYFAYRLRAAKLILVKDVDGIFTKDPKLYSDAALVRTLQADDLLTLNERTCVDRNLPKLLIDYLIPCYVINGKHPERIGSILSGRRATCTKILTDHRNL